MELAKLIHRLLNFYFADRNIVSVRHFGPLLSLNVTQHYEI
jgi:hypothetical protein